jgi:hypothetical protein
MLGKVILLIYLLAAFLIVGSFQKSDRVFRTGDWELQINFRAKNTRSEGQHGELFYQGRKITPETAGAELETALGKMKYYGDAGRIDRRWELSGWNFADPSRIKSAREKAEGGSDNETIE